MTYLVIPIFFYIFAKKYNIDMKICAFSDMHGQLDFKVEPCDIVLIGGDIVPLEIQSYSTPSEKWFKTVFIPWCNNLPCEKVVFIAGNHDWFLLRHPDRMRLMLKENGDKVVYLDCEIFEYQGKVIFGTPWCKPFGRWAFMESYEEQDASYARYLDIIGNEKHPTHYHLHIFFCLFLKYYYFPTFFFWNKKIDTVDKFLNI